SRSFPILSWQTVDSPLEERSQPYRITAAFMLGDDHFEKGVALNSFRPVLLSEANNFKVTLTNHSPWRYFYNRNGFYHILFRLFPQNDQLFKLSDYTVRWHIALGPLLGEIDNCHQPVCSEKFTVITHPDPRAPGLPMELELQFVLGPVRQQSEHDSWEVGIAIANNPSTLSYLARDRLQLFVTLPNDKPQKVLECIATDFKPAGGLYRLCSVALPEQIQHGLFRFKKPLDVTVKVTPYDMGAKVTRYCRKTVSLLKLFLPSD
ncbi:MAG: hypothetical protein MI749_16975, partial [Desulfovibrionales bacterium]|nr:hypothetical protein [Desulfovibrionales bacterium]